MGKRGVLPTACPLVGRWWGVSGAGLGCVATAKGRQWARTGQGLGKRGGSLPTAWDGWGLAWVGVGWHGLAWVGMAWHGVAWHGLARVGMAWHGLAWRGLRCHGFGIGVMDRHARAWVGMRWHALTEGSSKRDGRRSWQTGVFPGGFSPRNPRPPARKKFTPLRRRRPRGRGAAARPCPRDQYEARRSWQCTVFPRVWLPPPCA